MLHAFSSERREFLGIPPGTRVLRGVDLLEPLLDHRRRRHPDDRHLRHGRDSAIAVGEGTLLSPESHQAQIATDLRGFGAPLEGCPTCHTLDEPYNYGLGVVINGDWILQNPLFSGYGGGDGLPAAGEDRDRRRRHL